MLVNPKAYLARARREGWALGGFNVFNLESARAVIAAGEESAAPLLVQTSEGAVQHVGLETIVAIVRQLAGKTTAPVALHLDHGKSEALARAAIDAGYTSVMIDASRETFEENLRETRAIVAYAHSRGVHVEAELGTLGGIEDLGEQAGKSMLTDPEQAVRFAAETGVDALAVAIGTSHGAYKFKGEPHLDFDRLRNRATPLLRFEFSNDSLTGTASSGQEQIQLGTLRARAGAAPQRERGSACHDAARPTRSPRVRLVDISARVQMPDVVPTSSRNCWPASDRSHGHRRVDGSFIFMSFSWHQITEEALREPPHHDGRVLRPI